MTARRVVGAALLLSLLPALAFADDAGGISLQSFRDNAGEVPLSSRFISAMGLLIMVLAAWAMSTYRRKIHWRVLIYGVGLQVLLGVLVLRTDVGRGFFDGVKGAVDLLIGFTRQGAQLLFGPELLSFRSATFALIVLPTIIFFSSLMAVLYHLKIMQKLVGVFAWVMRRTLGTSGAESLSAAGNIFVGQTEAPLLIRPYVNAMTDSELMAVMVGGFATVAGGVMAAYVGMFSGVFPDMAGHLLTASIMSAPAALVVAKLMVPERGKPVTADSAAAGEGIDSVNVIDAAARGAGDGLKLAVNVGAMLLAFVALVAMLDYLIYWGADLVGVASLSKPDEHGAFNPGEGPLSQILGYLLAPVAWVMGVPWEDAPAIGSLLGVKTVLNEFFAYDLMSRMVQTGKIVHPHSLTLATYALCGFANFGSIAIQIGGIGGIAPARRADLARLGLRAMIGGTLAAFMTACVAGILL